MQKSFQKTPYSILRRGISPKEVYLYDKLQMLSLSNLHYDLKTTGTLYYKDKDGNQQLKKEISIMTVERYVKHLEELNFIKIGKFKKETSTHPFNNYLIVDSNPIKYESVTNDFLNLPTISADAKGFAIMLSILGYIPSSLKLISGILEIDVKTCRKYMKELTENNIIIDNKLSYIYFPNSFIPKYESKKAEILKCEGNTNFIKVIEWIEKKMFEHSQHLKYEYYNPFRWGLNMLYKLEQGEFENNFITEENTELADITL